MICDAVEIFLGQAAHLMLTQPACTSCVVSVEKKALHFSIEIFTAQKSTYLAPLKTGNLTGNFSQTMHTFVSSKENPHSIVSHLEI